MKINTYERLRVMYKLQQTDLLLILHMPIHHWMLRKEK